MHMLSAFVWPPCLVAERTERQIKFTEFFFVVVVTASQLLCHFVSQLLIWLVILKCEPKNDLAKGSSNQLQRIINKQMFYMLAYGQYSVSFNLSIELFPVN